MSALIGTFSRICPGRNLFQPFHSQTPILLTSESPVTIHHLCLLDLVLFPLTSRESPSQGRLAPRRPGTQHRMGLQPIMMILWYLQTIPPWILPHLQLAHPLLPMRSQQKLIWVEGGEVCLPFNLLLQICQFSIGSQRLPSSLMPSTAKSGKRGAEGNDETKNKTENLSKDALRKAETLSKKCSQDRISENWSNLIQFTGATTAR